MVDKSTPQASFSGQRTRAPLRYRRTNMTALLESLLGLRVRHVPNPYEMSAEEREYLRAVAAAARRRLEASGHLDAVLAADRERDERVKAA